MLYSQISAQEEDTAVMAVDVANVRKRKTPLEKPQLMDPSRHHHIRVVVEVVLRFIYMNIF